MTGVFYRAMLTIRSYAHLPRIIRMCHLEIRPLL